MSIAVEHERFILMAILLHKYILCVIAHKSKFVMLSFLSGGNS
jgi:hypothetical protein